MSWPTDAREALTEAVYRSELTRLCDGAAELLESMAPEVALREWFGRYLEFVSHQARDG